MSTYIAPIQDMLFTLREIGGFDTVAALPGNEEVSDELLKVILDEAGRFATEVLAPINAVGDRQGCSWQDGEVTTADGFKDAYASFCATGWHTLPAKVEFGGQGLPALVSSPVQEMWQSANMAFSLCQMLTVSVIEALSLYASEALKARYLPQMVAGTWTATKNLTEPQAGSDLAAMRTKAVPDGDHYRIFGTKNFITWGEHDLAENIIHLVLARLPDTPTGIKGVSLFLVPKYLVNADGSLGASNDLRCASIEDKLGIHGCPTAIMAYGEHEGAIGYLVGEPNRGLEYMFSVGNHARLNVGLLGVAISERAYQQALNYARERVQGRPAGEKNRAAKSIIHHPDVRRMLIDMKARTEAMRALIYYTAGQLDLASNSPDETARKQAEALADFLTPIAKGWCTENAVEIASTGIQVHGGMGYMEEMGACQHLRDARITTIFQGTTGIHANDLVGNKLAKEGGITARILVEQISALHAELVSSGDRDLQMMAAPLRQGMAAFIDTTDWLITLYNSEPQAAAAGAVAFLKLTGTLVGGWLMVKAARIACIRQAVGGGGDLAQAKLATARYFTTHVLPVTALYRDQIIDGANSVLGLEEGQF